MILWELLGQVIRSAEQARAVSACTFAQDRYKRDTMARNWVITFWWALPNLIVPLLAIPVVMVIQWMSRKRPSWQAVIEDGQVCFYSIAILASAWYDLKELMRKGEAIDAMDSWIFLVGGTRYAGLRDNGKRSHGSENAQQRPSRSGLGCCRSCICRVGTPSP